MSKNIKILEDYKISESEKIVLAHNTITDEYITWLYINNDFVWGNYFNNYFEARIDMKDRARAYQDTNRAIWS